MFALDYQVFHANPSNPENKIRSYNRIQWLNLNHILGSVRVHTDTKENTLYLKKVIEPFLNSVLLQVALLLIRLNPAKEIKRGVRTQR